MTAEERMRLLRALGRLEDEAVRLDGVDDDALRYVVRAANCLRARLGLAMLTTWDASPATAGITP